MSELAEKLVQDALAAAQRIRPIIRKTPLKYSSQLSAATGGKVYLKLENRQRSGSFKLRGASNRMLTLTAEQRKRGCVAASSGNHGAAVACAMRALGCSGIIFVPEQTSKKKVAAIRSYGGEVRYFGSDGLDTEQHAREYAREQGLFYVSPYNDEQVIAGQATCGLEIIEQCPDLDAVFVAVGGGGLISGIGSVMRAHRQGIRIVGAQPEASPVMTRSIAEGRVLDLPSAPTLSDGTAGGIEQDSVTFALCAELVDEFILVSEAEIAAAMRMFIAASGEAIEGAAGVALAALLARPELAAGRKVVVVICGGNVTREILDAVQGSA